MSRRPRTVIECRDYVLPPEFPIIALAGEEWRISDVRAPVLHFHNSLEIGICHSDSGTLEFQDTKHPFKAGDVTLIASGTPHTTYSAPGTASSWSYLFIDLMRLINPSVKNLSPAEMYKGFLYNFKLVVSEEQDPILAPLVREIVSEMQRRDTNYRYCVVALLDALLSKLSRYMPERDSAPPGKPFPIAPALWHIDSHYMVNFRIDDLAALCKMSTSYFRRLFTETIGMGPLEYLNRTRIMWACTLLQMTDLSILEICEAVGFISLSSFNRHFSATMGQPPTAWRRKVNANRPYTVQRYSGYLSPPKS